MLVHNLAFLVLLATVPRALALPTLSLQDLIKVKELIRYGMCTGMVDCLPLLVPKPHMALASVGVCVGLNVGLILQIKAPASCSSTSPSTATTTPLVAVAASATVLGVGLQLVSFLHPELAIVLPPDPDLRSLVHSELGISEIGDFREPCLAIAIICNVKPSYRTFCFGSCWMHLDINSNPDDEPPRRSICFGVCSRWLHLNSIFISDFGVFLQSEFSTTFIPDHAIILNCDDEPHRRSFGIGVRHRRPRWMYLADVDCERITIFFDVWVVANVDLERFSIASAIVIPRQLRTALEYRKYSFFSFSFDVRILADVNRERFIIAFAFIFLSNQWGVFLLLGRSYWKLERCHLHWRQQPCWMHPARFDL
ncbi:hypothetical protein RQP46_010270 [Phenoliferia psychrophenolica]